MEAAQAAYVEVNTLLIEELRSLCAARAAYFDPCFVALVQAESQAAGDLSRRTGGSSAPRAAPAGAARGGDEPPDWPTQLKAWESDIEFQRRVEEHLTAITNLSIV